MVLDVADKVVFGNGEGFQARRIGGERNTRLREFASLPL